MIFKPDWQLPSYQFYTYHILIYILIPFIIIPSTLALELDRSRIGRLEQEVGFKKDQEKNEMLILPFYPFKNNLTYEADSLYIIEAIPEAVRKYKLANRIFEDEGNWEGIAYTNNMVFEIYTNKMYDHNLAEEIYVMNSEIIKEKLGAQHPLISDTYLTYGSLLDYSGESEKALEILKLSLEIKIRTYGDRSIQVAEAYYRMGQHYHYSREDFERAFDFYNRSFIVFDMHLPKNHIDLVKVYYSLASIYRLRKDYQRANIYIDNAIYSYSTDSVRNLRRIALSEILKGNLLNSMSNFDYSTAYYSSASKKILQLQDENSYHLIYTNLGTGVSNLRKGYYNDVLNFLNEALRICNIYSSEDNPIDLLSFILEGKGAYFTKIGELDSARFNLYKSLEIHSKHFPDDRQMISKILESIGDMYKNFRLFDSALYYTQKALIKLIPEFDDLDYRINPILNFDENLPDLIQIMALKAEILQAIYASEPSNIDPLVEALKIYDQLDHLSNGVKNSDLAEESKLFIISDFHQIYNNAIHCTYQLFKNSEERYYLEKALNFLEKNKYMLLLQNLELARKSNEINIPAIYRYKADSLRQAFEEINRKIENSEQGVTDNLIIKRLEIDKAITELREEVSSIYPNFYQIEFDSLSVHLPQVQRYAKRNDNLLIEYFIGDSAIYIMGIDQDQVTFRKTKRTEILNNHITEFLSILSDGLMPGEGTQTSFTQYTESAFIIFQKILSPVLEDHTLKKGQQITISPDGILAQVPFDALISKVPESDYPDYTKLDYLLYDYKISYTYSLNLLLKESNTISKNNILAFSYSSINIQDNPAKRDRDLIELAGTSKETAAIKKIVRGDNLFLEDEDATESQFKEKSEDFQIIHLAVHGVGDLESSINSRLVFKNNKDSINDGYLFIYELYNLDLNNTKLIVLSACETGIGKEFKGEGTFSVARGFASAGCPSMVMSLWKVNDDISSQIMTKFYEHLTKGNRINEALEDAKIEYILESDPVMAHPSNWAGFVPLGQMNAIYKSPFRKIMTGIIIFTIIIIPIMIYSYLRKRNRVF